MLPSAHCSPRYSSSSIILRIFFFFFFNDPPTPEISPLPLHDALPFSLRALYGPLDEARGHFRRYVPAELSEKLCAAGFRLRHIEYFNLAGVPGWWVAGRVLRRRLIPTGALRWYEALVPLFRLERLLPWRIGQSLIAIGEVPG